MKGHSIVFALILILGSIGCRKASEGIPAYLKCDSARVISTLTAETNSQIYGLQVSLGTDNRGTWQMPFKMPILYEGSRDVLVSPVVKVNNLSTLFISYPFYKIKNINLNFVKDVVVDTILTFEYVDSVRLLMSENFETNTNFNTPAERSSDARNGNYSLKLAADFTSKDSSATSFYYKPINIELYKTVYMEFDYKMPEGILAPVLAYTDINGNIQISLGQSYLTASTGWTHVYWDLTTQASRSFDGKLTPVFILTPAKGGINSVAFIDNIKIIQK